MTNATTTGLAHETFLRDYGDTVAAGNAAVFVGAGMSRASGSVDWKGLLAEFADELGLDLEIETDLISVAQYHLNENNHNRNRLSQKIVDEFNGPFEPTANHLTLAKLPISLWWTTNYDDVVERALKSEGKRIQVIATLSSMTVRPTGTDTLLYKKHGDLNDVSNIVITKDDYESYVKKHPGFRTLLKSALTTCTFLFVGYSFTDPHFDFILSELRRSHGDNAKTHYAIMRREALVEDGDGAARSRHAVRRQQLRINDLKRYGIQTVLVDEHDEIPALLERLRQRYLRRQVFITGAQAGVEAGAQAVGSLATALGRGLIAGGYNLVSGLGLGVGGSAVFGALEKLYENNAQNIDRRLLLRPFPQEVAPEKRQELFTKYRRSMLTTAGFVVVMAGSKILGGNIVEASGMREEISLAKENNAFIIPVGRTGHIAAELWSEYNSDLSGVYGEALDVNAWAMLNDPHASDADVVGAIVNIMDALRPR